MNSDFQRILELRNAIQLATAELKNKLIALHESKGVTQPAKQIRDMGISELLIYVNELEAIVTLCGE